MRVKNLTNYNTCIIFMCVYVYIVFLLSLKEFLFQIPIGPIRGIGSKTHNNMHGLTQTSYLLLFFNEMFFLQILEDYNARNKETSNYIAQVVESKFVFG